MPLVDDESAEVVFVTHVDDVDLAQLERAARAVAAGAPLLTASYQPGYWGANGLIFSRGAMVTAAIAKVARRPSRPSSASRRPPPCDEIIVAARRPVRRVAVIGDDLGWTSRSAASAGRGRCWSAAG